MAQDVVQRIQQLLAEGRFDEARALLAGLNRPEVPQLLALIDQMERTAGAAGGQPAAPEAPEAPEGALLDRLREKRKQVQQPKLVSVEGDRKVYDAGTYQMLWDCQFCGTQKLLGITHRFCPNCGAPQNPDSRYYPAEEEMVAVENHEYVGEDQTCPACGGLNSGKAEYCGNCGGPLSAAARAKKLDAERRDVRGQFGSSGSRDVTKEAFQAEMQRVGVQPAPGAKTGGMPSWLPIVLILLAVVVCGGIVYSLVATQDTAVTVAGHAWQRAIQVEEFAAVEGSAWCDSVPGGAYNLTQRREVRRYNQVPDGEQCEMVRRDNGDGTFRMEQQCVTVYRDEPVYDQMCYFLVNTWVSSRVASAEGETLQEPNWPQANLACASMARLGCEREGGRSEAYLLYFRAADGGETYECPVSYDVWRSAALNSRWNLEVGKVMGDARCDTLSPAQ